METIIMGSLYKELLNIAIMNKGNKCPNMNNLSYRQQRALKVHNYLNYYLNVNFTENAHNTKPLAYWVQQAKIVLYKKY